MPTLGILTRRNLRKRRGQALAMLTLTVLGAALMNLGIIMAVRYPDLVHDKLADANAPDGATLWDDSPAAADLHRRLAQDPDVSAVEAQRVVSGTVETEYGGRTVNSFVLVFNNDEAPRMGRWRLVSEAAEPVAHPIYVPYVYATAGGFDLGDAIRFATPLGARTFHIQGFLEEPTLGMPSMGGLGFGLPADDYDTLVRHPLGLKRSVFLKVATVGHADVSKTLSRAVAGHAADHPRSLATSWWDTTTDLLSTGALLGAQIFAGGLVAFSLIISALTLVVMRFLLANAIADDMEQLGVLRAVGYTTGQVITQLAATFACCALVGAAVGVAASYAVLPTLAGALSDQTGLIWEPGFDPLAMAITLAVLTGTVLVLALVSALRVRRLTTLTALRGGTPTHEFRRNPLPLATTPGGVNPLLGVKAGLHRRAQSLLVAGTTLVAAFCVVTALGMSTTMLGNPKAFTHLIVGDFPEGTVATTSAAAARRVIADAQQRPGVELAYLSEITGMTVNGIAASVQIADTYDMLRYDSTYEGRMPRHGNEVALGSAMARRLGVTMGETVALDLDSHRAEYLVTGLTSSSRSIGLTVDLTTAGMRAANPDYRRRFVALHIADGTDIDDLLGELTRAHRHVVTATVNNRSGIDGQLSGYQAMVGALSTIVVGFMTCVAALVVALVVSTMIVQSRRRFGVLKTLGFTSRELFVQTLMTQVPVVVLGAGLGATLGGVLLNPTMGLLLHGIGIRQARFSLPASYPLWVTLVILLLTVAVAWLASRGLNRISAHTLITE